MQPDPQPLLNAAAIRFKPIGFYDAPDVMAFEPLVGPRHGRWACVFMFYKRWQRGDTLHITTDNHGCAGAGTYLFDRQTRSREEMIDFLYRQEGLKATSQLMDQWIDGARHYQPTHRHLFLGPLKPNQYQYLRTVTFFVNPDQLSLLMTGAHYCKAVGEPPAVLSSFAAGCGLLVSIFEDLKRPQAVIGAIDIAARKYIPPDIVAFTVTRPMFAQLCELDERSFLHKRFWQNLKRVRAR